MAAHGSTTDVHGSALLLLAEMCGDAPLEYAALAAQREILRVDATIAAHERELLDIDMHIAALTREQHRLDALERDFRHCFLRCFRDATELDRFLRAPCDFERDPSATELDFDTFAAAVRDYLRIDPSVTEIELRPPLRHELWEAYEAAKRENNPLLAEVLGKLLDCALVERPMALQMFVEAGRRGDRIHDGLQGRIRTLDVHAEVMRRISRLGPPHGEAADALAMQLATWLSDFNPGKNSDAYYARKDGTYTADTDRDLIRAAFPARLVRSGRVFVSITRPHREGASPRKGEALCLCASCESKRLMRAAERAMGGTMTFPRQRKKRSAKK